MLKNEWMTPVEFEKCETRPNSVQGQIYKYVDETAMCEIYQNIIITDTYHKI